MTTIMVDIQKQKLYVDGRATYVEGAVDVSILNRVKLCINAKDDLKVSDHTFTKVMSASSSSTGSRLIAGTGKVAKLRRFLSKYLKNGAMIQGECSSWKTTRYSVWLWTVEGNLRIS